MKYIWFIIFLILPIVGVFYTAWRVWHLLPFAIATKWVAVGILVVWFCTIFITDALYEKAYGPLQKGNTQYYISSGMGIWGGKFRIGTQSEYVVLTIEHISKLHTDFYKIIESFQPLIHLR